MVTPPAKKLAAELDVDLDLVAGTGGAGRITKADVQRAADEKPLTVVDAVTRDIAEIARRDPDMAKSGLAASALAMAGEIDSSETSATAKANCARALLDTLDRLRELMPEEEARDGVDDLHTRRATRLAGGAKAK